MRVFSHVSLIFFAVYPEVWMYNLLENFNSDCLLKNHLKDYDFCLKS